MNKGSLPMFQRQKNKIVQYCARGLGGEAVLQKRIALSPSLHAKKSHAKKIFGSNLFLNSRSLVSTPTPPYASLREARQNFSGNESCLKLEYLYGVVKTYFTRNF
jgi:hypothetical protein